MIILGCIARNLLPYDSLMSHFPDTVAGYLREGCLVLIILRAGMELDPKYVGILVLYLAILPPLCECVVLSLVSMKIFAMSSAMAFTLGFIAVGIGPAIIIPILVDLQKLGYGVVQGIPTMMIASSSVSVIFSIIFYSLCSSLTFNQIGGSV